VLSHPIDLQDLGPFEDFGLVGCGRFQGLTMRSKPGIDDAVAFDPRIHPARNSLHFGQFGHLDIVEEGLSRLA
jgi:hypothetical protein